MWKPLRESSFSFKHPLLWFITGYGLFSASLVPGVYSSYGYGTGRYMNMIYFFFLVMAIGSILYLEGSLIRWLEKQEREETKAFLHSTSQLGQRFTALHLILCVFFLVMGGFSNTIMNTSSVSAAKSIITGEAREVRRQMDEREEYIRLTDIDEIAVTPVITRPYVFKEDKLAWQGNYGPVRYMKRYFETHHNAEHPQQE